MSPASHSVHAPMVFIDTEFTDLATPQLLSLGAVTLDGREHYVELDLESGIGKRRIKVASEFVRCGGVLEQWGRVSGARATHFEMGRRTGAWLISLACRNRDRIQVAFDYPTDFDLMAQAIRDAGLWDRVREAVLTWPPRLATPSSGLASYTATTPWPTPWHCARPMWRSKGTAIRLSRFARSKEFLRLTAAVTSVLPIEHRDTFDAEGWTRRWLLEENRALGHHLAASTGWSG
jgi:hypothetical protein